MVGRTILRYKIVEKLGEGGMGVPYKAEDTTLGRAIAPNFLADHLRADPEPKKCFLLEAKAVAALHHHCACPVHEINRDGLSFGLGLWEEARTKQRRWCCAAYN
jgi:serine/threonine protein kinase